MNRNKPKINKELIAQNFKVAGIKIAELFKRFAFFINRHKIATIILTVVVVVFVAVFGVVNHFLNKINYVDTNSQTTSVQPVLLTLSSGEVIDVSGLTKNEDGTYTLPDGRRIDTDGTVWNLDGSIVFYDGSYLTADGVAVLSDGTTIYTDATVVFQDGDFISNTGIKVDKEGYASFKTGEKAHITAFTINKDGSVEAKPSSLVSPKYSADGTWNISDEEEEEEAVKNAKNNPEIKSALDENDKVIERNFNDNKIWYNDNIVNILLMGIDEGGKNYPYGRSDAMIILSINKQTKQVKMVSFSRAVYVAIQGYENTRLNHAHGYGGAALAIDTIERNYKIRIDNYVSTNFDTFQKLIDVIGGVSIKLTEAEAKALKSKIQKQGLTYNGAGTYNLQGELALEYVRLRKIDADRARTQRQRNVLMAIANKAKNMNVFQITSMLNSILPLITTDLSKTEILSQAAYLPSYLNGNVEQVVVPHESSSLQLIDGFEVLLLNWDDEVKYVHDVFYGDVVPSYYEK
ncbi:MAG: LCP family protein [Acutalibacteraceae bacterium]